MKTSIIFIFHFDALPDPPSPCLLQALLGVSTNAMSASGQGSSSSGGNSSSSVTLSAQLASIQNVLLKQTGVISAALRVRQGLGLGLSRV